MITEKTKFVICYRHYYEKDFKIGNIYKVELENFHDHIYVKIHDEKNDVLFFDTESIFNEVILPEFFKNYPISKMRKEKLKKLNSL